MTYFATCIGCNLKSDCEQLAAIKKKVAGLNLTSIKHRCRDRTPEFKPGDPVFVETYATMNWNEDDDGPASKGNYRGVFIREARARTQVIAFVAAGTLDHHGCNAFEPSHGGFIKVPRSRVIFADGPCTDVTECKHCGQILSLGQSCGWSTICGKPPKECLAEAKKEAA